MKKALLFALLLAGAGGFASSLAPDTKAPEQPTKQAPTKPAPKPKAPDTKPPDWKPRQPWGPRCPASVGRKQKGAVRDGSKHDGQTVQADLPADQLVPNCGGSDGMGLCVGTSIMFSARLQNVPQLKNFQEFLKKFPGGGWPRKVDSMIAAICKENNQPIPDYIQIENGDWSLVKLALKTGRMPAINYGRFHMVNLVKLENGYGAFRDNNYVGEKEIIWMSEEEAKQTSGGSHFWSVILLAPRPPMPPKNKPATCSAPYTPGNYTWFRFPDCFQWSLWRDGKQIGNYDASEDRYGVYDGSKWTNFYRRPPVDLPSDAYPALAGRVSGGVWYDLEIAPRYSRNGIVISRREAEAALTLEDDSQRPSLTVIGSQAEIDNFRAAYVAQPDLARRFVFQAYTPDDWAINTDRFGFAHDGSPTIYVQKPNGEVLLHLTSFDGGTLAQIRVKDPSYNPASDPGMQPSPEPEPLPPEIEYLPTVVAGLLGFGLTLLLTMKESK